MNAKKTPLPQHIGFIPDGNRRWASEKGMKKQEGYAFGITPGLALVDVCRKRGIEEISIYGFTQDNTRRPAEQKDSFSRACVEFAHAVAGTGVALLVVGDSQSRLFPSALQAYTQRQGSGIKVNLLVNYGWDWDLQGLKTGDIRSKDVSRIDLIVRWGRAPSKRLSSRTVGLRRHLRHRRLLARLPSLSHRGRVCLVPATRPQPGRLRSVAGKDYGRAAY